MIYETLKSLVEWLKTSYKCPECGVWISEKDIEIVWAAWNTVNFDVACPKCGKHWIVKSQLMMVDLNWLTQIKHKFEDIKEKLTLWEKEETKISDKQIINLDRDLKNEKINAKDIFE